MGEAVGLWLEGHRVSTAFQLWVRVHQNQKDASRLSSAHLVRRFFQGWREVVKEGVFTWRSTENKVCTSLIQSAFRLWRRRAASHKASQDLAQRVTDRKRRSLLMSSLHAWHQEVQSCRRRSLLLSEKYYACWVERATARRNKRRSLLEWILREYIRRWRLEAVLRRVQRRHTQDLWDNWRDQTAATLLLRTLYTDRLQQGAWLTWRKRRIRTRVSKDLATRFNRSLAAQVFLAWRRRALCSVTNG
ncbi:uncharacterized protein LOC124481077 [Hypomesus transpacificus]|uniref:uncharacterized protein LOC124481077 n=1 Tax=Hypomesus transpacificus TaxID=137520 RepID=UPI001F085E59|nr:uncharacterized protein LOC124481077 [Hypomesus transpacificus]